MKSLKYLLSGIMLILLAICGFVMDSGNSSWLSGVAVGLVPVAVVVFIVGLFTKNKA